MPAALERPRDDVQPATRADEPTRGCRDASRVRRTFYQLWGLLPPRLQGTLIRLGSPKVTLGACAVIRNAQGHVLLVHHTYRRRAWGLPGGLAGTHEQPEAALARELREELGVRVMIGPLLYAELCQPNSHLTLYYEVTIAGTPCGDGVEIDGLRYVAPEEAAALLNAADAPWLAA